MNPVPSSQRGAILIVTLVMLLLLTLLALGSMRGTTLEERMAGNLRDESQAPPPDIEPRRMAVYRRLFYNAVEGLLAANFPVIRKTLGDAGWHARVHDFHREHRCRTPLFTEVALEFIEWAAAREDPDAPWLANW